MNARTYIRLCEARSPDRRGQKVNIGGVIVEFSCPKKSKGTDYCCHFKLVDESHGEPGVPVNIFEYELESLPLLVSPGDIILLSGVMMKEHDKEVYAVYNKKFSGFALYRGKSSQNLVPYQISSKFSAKEVDKRLVARLRDWFVDVRLSEESTKFHTFTEMVVKKEECVNLVCKVLYTFETAEGAWVFLWDGTDAPPNRIYTTLAAEMDEPLSLHLGDGVVPRDILCSFPLVGTVLKVHITREYWKYINIWINCCTWLKYMHVQCTMQEGLWTLVTPDDSSPRFRYAAKEERIVQDRERKYEGRVSLKSRRIPSLCFPHPTLITVVDHHDVGFSTLMDVLTHKEVTAKFKCIVRFVALLPMKIPSLHSKEPYLFRFTLEDPTARLHAFAYAEDADLFFGTRVLEDIMWKLNRLLGVNSDDGKEAEAGVGRNPVWVQCCLKSYYTDKNDKWGSRRYRIFETQLL